MAEQKQGKAKYAYDVEKDVELPVVLRRNTIYPFNAMEVGDSFFVDAGENLTITAKKVRGAVASHHNTLKIPDPDGGTHPNRHGEEICNTVFLRHFSVRVFAEDPVHGVPGVRVIRNK